MRSAKNTIGFMQGRLCDLVDGKIQAFPWRDWETEFPVAASIDFHLMEWTLDQDRLYGNPLMRKDGQLRIINLCKQYEVEVISLTGDCFMQAPFWKAEDQVKVDLKADFISICEACSNIGIKMVVVPLVDNGRIENMDQEDELVSFLSDQMDVLKKLGIKIIFESDFPPSNLQRFINRLPVGQFGINYDIGNSAALGFDPVEEFGAYGSRVMNVHVKDRILGGTTVPLTSGNADFKKVFAELANINYQGNYILQTARADDAGHAAVLARYRDMTIDWMHAA